MYKFLVRKRFGNRYHYWTGEVQHTGLPVWTTEKDQAKKFYDPAQAWHAVCINKIEAAVISPIKVELQKPDDVYVWIEPQGRSAKFTFVEWA